LVRSPLLLGIVLVACALRLPALSLPLEGAGARLASLGGHLGTEQGWVPRGEAPLVPALTAILVSAGLHPTQALRVLDLCMAMLLPVLGFGLARGLGCRRSTGYWFAFLLAVHPLLVLGIGGALVGTAGVATVLVLGGLWAVSSTRPWMRRLGLLSACLLPFCSPAGAVFTPALLWLHAREEPGRLRVLGPLVGALALVFGPVLPAWTSGTPQSALSFVLGWLPLVLLGGLFVGLPAGLHHLLRSEGRTAIVARAWLMSATGLLALQLLRGLEGPLSLDLDSSAGLLLVPPLLLAGVVGLERSGWRLAPGVRMGSALAGVLLGAFVANGGLQVRIDPSAPLAAGRLEYLRSASHQAADVVGPGGWIVLDVAGMDPDAQASLADTLEGRWLWRREALTEGLAVAPVRQLPTFPARSYPAGDHFAMVVPAPRRGDPAVLDSLTTFGGASIFQQDIVERVGAFLVLKLEGHGPHGTNR
jgi:hypothetical protein